MENHDLKKALKDDEVLALYFHEIADELTRIAIKITGNLDVDDILSETIIRAFKYRKKVKKPEYLKTWIIRILINNCKDYLRTNNKFVELVDDYEIVVENESFDFVNDYIDKLPTTCRNIIVLKYFSELSFREIAEALEMKESNVKYHYYQGLKLLKVEMEELYE